MSATLTAIFSLLVAARVSIPGALAVLAITCPAIYPQAATALEPGVQIDPSSPAAKEYALPLNQARQIAQRAAPGEASANVPFGAGIKPPGSGGASPPASTGASPALRARRGRFAARRTLASLPVAVLRASSTQGAPGNSGSILALLGGGVAILLIGGLGGALMRRPRNPTPS